MGTVLISNSSLSWTDLSCLLESSAHFRMSRDRSSAIQNSYKFLLLPTPILVPISSIYGLPISGQPASVFSELHLPISGKCARSFPLESHLAHHTLACHTIQQ